MRFINVKPFVTFLFIFIGLNSNGQHNGEKSCHTNVELDVAIDTVYQHPDSSIKKDSVNRSFSVDYAWFCNPCYVLRPLNEKFKVVRFKIISESDEEIIERFFTGDTITINSGIVEITRAKTGSTILLDCIQARHENGKIYILRDLSIRK